MPDERSVVERAPRVVMIVNNDITHDTRVLKMGVALADAGLGVTLLGVSASGEREESSVGGAHILRIPVTYNLSKAHAERRARRRRPRLQIAAEAPELEALRLRTRLRRRELRSTGGLRPRLRVTELRARWWIARVRRTVQRSSKWFGRMAWQRNDSLIQSVRVGADWRRQLPEIDDLELAFAKVLDKLEWDVLHAHDVHMVGLACRAVARRRASGRDAKWVYDAHEYVAGISLYGQRTVRKRAAYLDLEREYIRDADAVLTVTQPLAEQLRDDYKLPTRPAVVMNATEPGADDRTMDGGVRQRLGLAEGVPLMVYSGGVTRARGIDTAVEALPLLPGVHFAIICVPRTDIPYVRDVAASAAALGAGDRLHLLEPVPADEVSAFVASADIGLSPILHFGSHEFALPNKLFEYLHGGLPVLVSDCKAQAGFVREHGVGGVHVAGDPASFARKLTALMAGIEQVRQRIRDDHELLIPYSWEQQVGTLRAVYQDLLGKGAVLEPELPTTRSTGWLQE